MKYKWICILFMMFVLMVGSDVYAESDKIDQIHQQLGLSEDQISKLKSNRQAHRQQLENLRSTIKSKRQMLNQMLQSSGADQSQVKALHQEIKALRSQKEDRRLNSIMAVRGILSPEQFQKFMALKKDRKGKKSKEFKGSGYKGSKY